MKKIVLLVFFLVFMSCEKKNEYSTYHENGMIKTETKSVLKRNSYKIVNTYVNTKTYDENGKLIWTMEENYEWEKYYMPWEIQASSEGGNLRNKEIISSTFKEGIKERTIKTANDSYEWIKGFYESGRVEKEIIFKNGDEYGTIEYNEDGSLGLEKYYFDEWENSSVKHYYENGLLTIDDNYNPPYDTIIKPFTIKTFDNLGRIQTLGVAKPVTVADDSDFDRNGSLWQLELDVYNEAIGKRDINGRMIGAIKLEHPDFKFEGKYDLRTGNKENGAFWSTNDWFGNERWYGLNRLSNDYRLFSGLYFHYFFKDKKTYYDGSQVKTILSSAEITPVNKDLKKVIGIEIVKDGVSIQKIHLFMDDPRNPGDFSREFEQEGYYTDFSQYLSEEKSESSSSYYFEDIKLIEDKFEFRLGRFVSSDISSPSEKYNYDTGLSPFAYSYNDLIKSPQGKLVKVVD